MNLIQQLKDVCNQVPGYHFEFDEVQMRANIHSLNNYPSIFFHEYREGKYTELFYAEKSSTVQLYISKLNLGNDNTLQRETLRKQIEAEAIIPLMSLLHNHTSLVVLGREWKFEIVPARFHPNEVGILLTFTLQQIQC